MNLAKEQKQEIVSAYKKSDNDTGSAEVQIALLTQKINELTEHFKKFKKDHQSRRGLLNLVSRRRKLLAYLKKKDHKGYDEMIKKLELRK